MILQLSHFWNGINAYSPMGINLLLMCWNVPGTEPLQTYYYVEKRQLLIACSMKWDEIRTLLIFFAPPPILDTQ